MKWRMAIEKKKNEKKELERSLSSTVCVCVCKYGHQQTLLWDKRKQKVVCENHRFLVPSLSFVFFSHYSFSYRWYYVRIKKSNKKTHFEPKNLYMATNTFKYQPSRPDSQISSSSSWWLNHPFNNRIIQKGKDRINNK